MRIKRHLFSPQITSPYGKRLPPRPLCIHSVSDGTVQGGLSGTRAILSLFCWILLPSPRNSLPNKRFENDHDLEHLFLLCQRIIISESTAPCFHQGVSRKRKESTRLRTKLLTHRLFLHDLTPAMLVYQANRVGVN